jgi:hypothetical protein
MRTFAGERAFWKNNAFWVVVMPTTLVAVVFVLAIVANALG